MSNHSEKENNGSGPAIAVIKRFPFYSAIAYLELFLCVMPFVIGIRVPDIYGFTSINKALRYFAIGFPLFLITVVLLRGIKVDLEEMIRTFRGRNLREIVFQPKESFLERHQKTFGQFLQQATLKPPQADSGKYYKARFIIYEIRIVISYLLSLNYAGMIFSRMKAAVLWILSIDYRPFLLILVLVTYFVMRSAPLNYLFIAIFIIYIVAGPHKTIDRDLPKKRKRVIILAAVSLLFSLISSASPAFASTSYNIGFFPTIYCLVLLGSHAVASIRKTALARKSEDPGPREGRRIDIYPILINEYSIRSFTIALSLLVSAFRIVISMLVFYYPLMLFSFNIRMFVSGILLSLCFVFFLWIFRNRMCTIIRPGMFAGYMLLVWFAVFYVQNFNRVPPNDNECSAVSQKTEAQRLVNGDHFKDNDMLSHSLPYDVIFDDESGVLIVTFKNLFGYGAVGLYNMQKEELVDYFITENDINPDLIFYPERLCIDRNKKKGYSSTKAQGNFQLLDFGYSTDQVSLENKVRYASLETTNCQVDQDREEIYVIFLGPPANTLIVIDEDTKEQKRGISFEGTSYADYFVVDKKKDRVIIPSLDPSKSFDVYEVKNRPGEEMTAVRRPLIYRLKLPLGLNLPIRIPTLGIAYNETDDRLYFSCPFVRQVIEVDGSSFEVLRTVRTDDFPREMAWNEKRGILYVNNYSTGTLMAIDGDSFEVLKRFRLGKLIRSVTVDPDTGRTFAVSGCGVFEIPAMEHL